LVGRSLLGNAFIRYPELWEVTPSHRAPRVPPFFVIGTGGFVGFRLGRAGPSSTAEEPDPW
jgi:hypothetical protein